MGLGWLDIIGHRFSKSTFGANDIGLRELYAVRVGWGGCMGWDSM